MMPMKYKNPKVLEKKIEAYFNDTEFSKYTISGICLYLRINKDTFYEYGKRDGYKEIIEFARLRIENSYEMDFREKGRSADIFAMKNFGWSDHSNDVENQEEESSGVIMMPEVNNGS